MLFHFELCEVHDVGTVLIVSRLVGHKLFGQTRGRNYGLAGQQDVFFGMQYALANNTFTRPVSQDIMIYVLQKQEMYLVSIVSMLVD